MVSGAHGGLQTVRQPASMGGAERHGRFGLLGAAAQTDEHRNPGSVRRVGAGSTRLRRTQEPLVLPAKSPWCDSECGFRMGEEMKTLVRTPSWRARVKPLPYHEPRVLQPSHVRVLTSFLDRDLLWFRHNPPMEESSLAATKIGGDVDAFGDHWRENERKVVQRYHELLMLRTGPSL